VLQQINIDELVTKMVNMDGSDLHLKMGSPSAIRARGLLQRLEGYEVLRPADTEDMVRDIMSGKVSSRRLRRKGRRTSPTRSRGWVVSG
jgi:Tfp pilus assembly pilus retraction ATPase PilT